MATAKQLAALKKARAARKKNLAKKKAPTKAPTKAVNRRSSPKTSYYVVYCVKNRKRWYFAGKSLNDDIDKARRYSNKHLADAACEIVKACGHTFKPLKK